MKKNEALIGIVLVCSFISTAIKSYDDDAFNVIKQPSFAKEYEIRIQNAYHAPLVYQTTKECVIGTEYRGITLAKGETKVFGYAKLNETGDNITIRTPDKMGYALEGFCLRSSGMGSQHGLGLHSFTNLKNEFDKWKQQIFYRLKYEKNKPEPRLMQITIRPSEAPKSGWSYYLPKTITDTVAEWNVEFTID